jgi:hypothetical protein
LIYQRSSQLAALARAWVSYVEDLNSLAKKPVKTLLKIVVGLAVMFIVAIGAAETDSVLGE